MDVSSFRDAARRERPRAGRPLREARRAGAGRRRPRVVRGRRPGAERRVPTPRGGSPPGGRDFTLLDGDDAASVGPGTATHLRQQGLRTLDRTRYLGALLDPPRTGLGQTLYSDGRSGTIAVRRLGDALAFTASVGIPGFDAPNVPRDVPLRLSGVA
ncbi:MAG: hypothetical protein KJ062_23800, partial [Thermoanaerobaculia bacterium]|nr:hypothetical protein [Thermoanaerobaculia bacterium]